MDVRHMNALCEVAISDIQIYPFVHILFINSQMKKGRQFKWQNEEEKMVKAENKKII